MEVYNRYLKHPHNAEIAFVDSGMFVCRVYFVELHDGKRGFYFDKNQQLRGVEQSKRYKQDSFKNDFIKEISSSMRNYMIIKVIKDPQNNELEGDTMLFYVGAKISGIIGSNKSKFYNKSFMIKTELVNNMFPSFDNSHFTNFDVDFKDTIDIEQHINFPILDIEKMEKQKARKEKLEYIQKKTSIKAELLLILKNNDDNEVKVEEIINLIS